MLSLGAYARTTSPALVIEFDKLSKFIKIGDNYNLISEEYEDNFYMYLPPQDEHGQIHYFSIYLGGNSFEFSITKAYEKDGLIYIFSDKVLVRVRGGTY